MAAGGTPARCAAGCRCAQAGCRRGRLQCVAGCRAQTGARDPRPTLDAQGNRTGHCLHCGHSVEARLDRQLLCTQLTHGGVHRCACMRSAGVAQPGPPALSTSGGRAAAAGPRPAWCRAGAHRWSLAHGGLQRNRPVRPHVAMRRRACDCCAAAMRPPRRSLLAPRAPPPAHTIHLGL